MLDLVAVRAMYQFVAHSPSGDLEGTESLIFRGHDAGVQVANLHIGPRDLW
jgi:hypothetical protein